MRWFTMAGAVAALGSILLPVEGLAADGRFWAPPASRGSCESGTKVVPLPLQKQVFGWKPDNRGVDFAAAIARNTSRGIASRSFDAPGFASQLTKAAQSGAYTTPVFAGGNRPSPIFLTSAILITLSYAVDLLDARGAWVPGQREAVVRWGNVLDKNQNRQNNPSRDSVAAFAAARMAWGAATGQPTIYKRGLSAFKKTGRLMPPDGFFERNPRDNNEVVGLMVLAATAAENLGQNAFGMSFRGVTLHDAVRAHSELTINIGPVAIREGDTGHTGKYLRPSGYAAHLAWIPIYLARHPNTEAARSVRKLERVMKQTSGGRYDGTNLGGPTACYWR